VNTGCFPTKSLRASARATHLSRREAELHSTVPLRSGGRTSVATVAAHRDLKRLLKLIPYKRIGEPEDIAPAAMWLASDVADYSPVLRCMSTVA
jgi:hypothetical protein